MSIDIKTKETPTAQKLLGIRATNTLKLVEKIEKGLPFSVFVRLRKRTGLPSDVLLETLGIKPRTFMRRKKTKAFTPEESDRLVSLSRLFARIIALFEGDEDAARDWITKPNRALGGSTPLKFATTQTGTREVENLIGRIEHGVFG
ncbi:MAG: DUF2384 domain-containing protein [Pyrinomonadaceae bacterium]|nr:DUF2384 domain-containing protein [Pyrinomonadaceae bacterium]